MDVRDLRLLVPVVLVGLLSLLPSAQAKPGKDDARRDAISKANQAMRAVDDKAQTPDALIAGELLKSYRDAIETLRPLDDATARYHGYKLTSYELEQAWRGAESELGKGFTAVLGGEVATTGVSEGKRLSVVVAAKKGQCYTAFLRFKKPGGRDSIEGLAWSAPNADAGLQPYVNFEHGPVNEYKVGFCATKDLQATLTGEVTVAGTKNGVRHVVLAHEKAKFPLWLSVYLNAQWGDPCDLDTWYSLWSDPIPGTLVYFKGEPHLLVSAGLINQSAVMLASATLNSRVAATKKDLTSAPPAKVRIATAYAFPGCIREKPVHPDSARLTKCHQGIDKKYKAPWDAANAELDRARTDGAARAAQAKLDRIHAQDEADREKTCKPIENELSKKWQATFDKIVDLYTEHPPPMTLDRAAELAAHARAFGF